MKNRELASRITINCKVTTQRGGARYDLYRLSTYQAKLCDDGAIKWQFSCRTRKYTLSQIYKNHGKEIEFNGGLVGRYVHRNFAIEKIGKVAVMQIESSGWKFKDDWRRNDL